MKQKNRRDPNRELIVSAVALIAVLAGGASAHAADGAGIYLEPSLTYELGNSTTHYPSPLSDASGTLEGFGVGARAGMHVSEAFLLGLDARYSMPQFKDSSVSYDARAVAWNFGPVIGMQMPIVGLRLWASYIAGGGLDPEKSGSVDVKFTEATGYRVGAGMRLAAVSLNLEFQQLKYNKGALESLGPFSPGTNLDSVNPDVKSWIASVSFPLEL